MSTYIEQVAADYSKVCRSFDELRRHQVEHIHGRAYTPMDELVTWIMFEIGNIAVKDVADSEAARLWSGVPLRALPLDTGTGKTQGALAFIAHAHKLDPQLSAGYVAGSIQGLLDTMRDLQKLGVNPAVSFNNWRGDNQKHVDEAGTNYVKDRYQLPKHRIILVTHKFWSEGNREVVTKYLGWRRSMCVIDECPELVEVYKCDPKTVQDFLSRLTGLGTRPDWRRVLADVAERMNRATLLTGPTFTPERIIDESEAAILGSPTRSEFEPYVDETLSQDEKIKAVNRLMYLFAFLTRAVNDACFYSRRETVFFSYRLKFQPSPGNILLDATADVHELVTLLPGSEVMRSVPKVDYSNLTLLHVEHPKEFRSNVTKSADGAKRYADWMRSVVLANTAPGDDVLVVTNKNIVHQHYLEPVAGWDGRAVDCVWWGGPFNGTNRYKDKTHVFCFGEAHRPRSSDVADVHGISMLPMTELVLKDAIGRPTAGGEYAPTGIYLKPWRGRLLAMTKQAAMRGRARNIDEFGMAQPMVLLTTMPIKRLTANLTALFPGAGWIKAGKAPGGSEPSKPGKLGTRVHKLSAELGRTDRDRIGSGEIEARLDIPSTELKKVFDKAAMPGWRLMSSRDLKLSGRQKWLVRTESPA